MKNFSYNFFPLTIFLSIIFGSNVIENFIIVGNTKTLDSIILEQIHHPYNVPFNSEIAKKDIDRLIDMNIFDYVDISFYNSAYYINVKEKKLLSFSPIIDREDGIGWSVGPILNINNIKGTASNINIGISMGAIESGHLEYSRGNKEWGYYYNQYNSIESDYLLSKKNLFLNYSIKINKFITLTPQLIEYNVLYTDLEPKTYQYITFSTNYTRKRNSSPHSINSNLQYNYSLDNHPSYANILFSHKYMLEINNVNSLAIVSFNTKLIFNSINNTPDFEYIYLGGENYVRGYYPNPKDNPEESISKLKFKNLLFHSIQFEIPFSINKFFKTKLLFFHDTAFGSMNYNKFKNKLTGYGWGISIQALDDIRFDICIGLNHWGSRTIHFIYN